MSFFSSPLSGLSASSSALQTISNNLANMNTDGYKAQTTDFSDVFYQNYGTSGSGNPIQRGLGVQVSGTTSDLSNGTVSQTGVASNMALDGPGYFVVKGADGALNYTRSGDFTTNATGQLTTEDGQMVMGYPAVGGVVDTTQGLTPLNVGKGTSTPASATKTFSMTTNLNSASADETTFSSPPISVYDSLGAAHDLTVTYTKTGSNAWSYAVMVPSADISGGTGSTTTIGSVTLSFDSTGQLVSPTGNVSVNAGPLSDGADAISATWNLFGTGGTSLVTQTASTSANAATTQDGFAAGTLSTFAVQTDGSIQATFTNGQNRTIGQVVVAGFPNEEGLSMNGNSTYSMTSASGAPVIGTAGTGGRATIKGSAVEESNVDVATEFAKMIVAQRSYEANAKAVTTFDQVEQATIAMKS